MKIFNIEQKGFMKIPNGSSRNSKYNQLIPQQKFYNKSEELKGRTSDLQNMSEERK